MLIGSENVRAAVPTPSRMNARMISSVAYADEEIASELKIARADFFERRSPISSSEASGRPSATALADAMIRPTFVFGALAAGLATSWFGPVYRKYGECGRSTRRRLSPS